MPNRNPLLIIFGQGLSLSRDITTVELEIRRETPTCIFIPINARFSTFGFRIDKPHVAGCAFICADIAFVPEWSVFFDINAFHIDTDNPHNIILWQEIIQEDRSDDKQKNGW